MGGATVTIEFSTFSDNTANGARWQFRRRDSSQQWLCRDQPQYPCQFASRDWIVTNLPLGSAVFTNSLVENNSDCTGTFTIGDPGLGALANNGGPTQTMAISSSAWPSTPLRVVTPSPPISAASHVLRVRAVTLAHTNFQNRAVPTPQYEPTFTLLHALLPHVGTFQQSRSMVRLPMTAR